MEESKERDTEKYVKNAEEAQRVRREHRESMG